MDDITNNKDTNNVEQQKILQKINKLIIGDIDQIKYKWNLINENYFTTIKQKTNLKIINNIKTIKDDISKKLGILGPHYFLSEFFCNYDYSCPYNNLEKGLLIIYEILNSISFQDEDENHISNYMPASSYYEIKKELYNIQKKNLNNWLDISLLEMFSSDVLRLDRKMMEKDDDIQHVTLKLFIYDNTKNIDNYDRKENKFLTPFICDRKGFIIWVGNTFKKTKNYTLDIIDLKEIMSNTDCLVIPYPEHVDKLINYNNNNFVLKNYCFKILNDKNIPISINFNNLIDNLNKNILQELNIFKKLSSINCGNNMIYYNLQFKLAALLLNFKKGVDYILNNNDIKYKRWLNDDCRFINNKKINVMKHKYLYSDNYKNDIENNQRNVLLSRINQLDD